ncbi:hypothetical protein [Pengzhenrongella sicca]|uniref:Transmembrane protein n=1 Tax=Pengzhenrongella sicca TaxID=2819238 RepID=A0A8A4ZG93_9MICO|nr:hypothetical protein [Pengzhenrongella sicca]QTE29963.1 hypothetical protein J4E96_02750 [Pengzhenrongella sicca]
MTMRQGEAMPTGLSQYRRAWIAGAIGYVCSLVVAVLLLTILAGVATPATVANLSWLVMYGPVVAGTVVAVRAAPWQRRPTWAQPLIAAAGVATVAVVAAVWSSWQADRHLAGGLRLSVVIVSIAGPVVATAVVAFAVGRLHAGTTPQSSEHRSV